MAAAGVEGVGEIDGEREIGEERMERGDEVELGGVGLRNACFEVFSGGFNGGDIAIVVRLKRALFLRHFGWREGGREGLIRVHIGIIEGTTWCVYVLLIPNWNPIHFNSILKKIKRF